MSSERAYNLHRADHLQGEVRIQDIDTELKGEWVLVRVTEFDDYHTPIRGEILAHAPDSEAVHDAIPPYSPDNPSDGPYYVFKASPLLRSGPEVDQAADQLVAELNAKFAEKRRGMA
jgi:hypothetical protein